MYNISEFRTYWHGIDEESCLSCILSSKTTKEFYAWLGFIAMWGNLDRNGAEEVYKKLMSDKNVLRHFKTLEVDM